MRLLCIGDLHIKVENLATIDLLEKYICNYCSGLDAIIILGDVLHTFEKLHTATLNRACELFSKLAAFGYPVYILVGNHDYIQNDQFLTTNHWMNAIKDWSNIYVVDHIVYFEKNNQFITLCPYVPSGRFIEALNTGARAWKESKTIFAHQEFAGAKMNNGFVSVAGDEWSCKYPMVISGHVHTRQQLETGVHYVGAALPNSEGKSYLSLLDTVLESIEQIVFTFPRRRRITNITVDDLLKMEVEDVAVIVIVDTYDNYKMFQRSQPYKGLVDRGIAVNFKPVVDLEDDDEGGGAIQTTFSDYLLAGVLDKEDEYLYCAYEKIVCDRDVHEEDILMVHLTTRAR